MSIIDVVKKLLGLAGADSATQAAVGGIMQSVSASRQAAENEDMLGMPIRRSSTHPKLLGRWPT